MNPELKTRWVKALRSGRYKQGFHSLERVEEETGKNAYCCLGVLCKTSRVGQFKDENFFYPNPEWNPKDNEVRKSGVDSYYRLDNRLIHKKIMLASALDDTLLTRFGITADEQQDLIEMNDSGEYSFNQIADWIEENL